MMRQIWKELINSYRNMTTEIEKVVMERYPVTDWEKICEAERQRREAKRNILRNRLNEQRAETTVRRQAFKENESL